jgi:carboxypeptidase Taq
MHIMLRFEIENDLINERLAVKDLPDAWNERMEAYLGVVPPDDAQGVLQDIHWSQGGYGYFPDYLLGSMLASQLWEGVLKAIPDAAGQVGQGQFGAINAWMRENIQQYGGVYTFHELAELATGAPFSADPYVNYLETKYSEVYGL